MSNKRCQILLLTIIYLTLVQSQIWNGKFQVYSTCPTNTCCCPSDTVSIIPSLENQLYINFTLVGTLCFGVQTAKLWNITMQTEYNFTQTSDVYPITYLFTLNNDSNLLTIANTFGAECTVNATRIFETTTHMLNNTAQFYQWNGLQKSLIYLFFFILASIDFNFNV